MTSKPESGKVSKIRVGVFTFFAVLFAAGSLFLLEGFTEGLMPWVVLGCPGCESTTTVSLHLWHGAEHGALLGVLFAGSLIALLWKPWKKPLLLQFYIAGHLLLLAFWTHPALGDVLQKPFVIVVFLANVMILFFTYPDRKALLNFKRTEPCNRTLLILTGIAAIILAPLMWQNLQLQLAGLDEHAQFFRYSESILVSLQLLLGSLLAATRRSGWKQLTIVIGIAYIYLGLGAITVPYSIGSWGYYGGASAILAGASYFAVAVLDKNLSFHKNNPTHVPPAN
ncbi:hypothetical protein Q73_15775 [Bacillus coahuilensis m2-6]|uniref:hypothetical protein n=1 Tax=Bacillus coahuilensis TaxID=408580 RepID=UPI00018507A1|nr:hypothetical protein [Bacillus coahuilensis]KUP04335.1 hypothetical protein Q73_15775 [Bacillus coahuilensis m2-6]